MPTLRLTGALVTVAVLAFLYVGVARAAEPPCRPSLVERQRYGFVAVSGNWGQRFDYGQLRAGWYVGSGSNGVAPGEMDRALGLGTHAGYAVNPATLGPLVDSNPGSLWLIGNEPDCIWQDDVLPEEYARIYHDLYLFIKNRDQTSQIAAGGIVQPTPLRLEYLDRVLAAYREQYSQDMPLDVWHIHNAILNEVSCDYDPANCWGAEIPPGIEAPYGEIRTIDDNDNMAFFEDQIWAFRQWMAENGYAGYPLAVTEYGILMPAEYGFPEARVNAFMSNTSDFFSSATDSLLGDPTDGDRLVQRWAWFSLDVQPWDPVTQEGFNGNLFDPVTAGITASGQHYASLTSSFPPMLYVDLGLAAWDAPPMPLVVSPTETISYSLRVRIVNRGTADSGAFKTTLAYDGPVSDTLDKTVTNLPPVSSQWLTFTLTDLQVGSYLLSLGIDPDGQVAEAAECNNQATRTVVVPRYRLYLPLALNRGAGTPLHEGAIESDLDSLRGTGQRTAYLLAPPGADRSPGFLEFEAPTADSYPAQLALDAGRQVLWVAERDGNKLAAFDLQSETWGQEFVIPTPGSQPWGLAVDGDGNVWFAETAADQIGKLLVASGTISEYANLTENSQPWDVAVGGDATVWFTEKAANQIGRLDPDVGTVTEYTLPTADARPAGIAISGEYVWFAESAASKLGRLKTLDGSIVEIQTPTSNSVPQEVVVAGNRNCWITEMAVDQIAVLKVSTVGWFTEVGVHTTNSEPYGIAMEGDVAVWFTERAGNKLGRFTGTVPPSEYALPTPNSLPTDIVVDDAGCAWYTAPGANRIGRLCLPLKTYLPLIVRNGSVVGER